MATSIEQVRFYLADDGTPGVLPSGSSMTDAQVQMLLDQEGGDVMRATALGYETLAARFAQVVSVAVGPRREELSNIANAYLKLGAEWRAKYGRTVDEDGAQGMSGFAVKLRRQDGYSDDAGATDGSESEGWA